MSGRSNVVRRRGKPNRGGGNRGRGGRGGRGRGTNTGPQSQRSTSGGGGSFSRKQSDYDFDDLPVTTTSFGANNYDENYPSSYPSFQRRGSNRGRPVKTRVQMQHLHMTAENQEMVKDMLSDLHGGDITQPTEEYDGEDQYDELNWRAENQYWTTDNKLNIENIETNTLTEVQAEQAQYDQFNQLALNKLQRYGFHKSRCAKALTYTDGDIGQSLEYLLSQCFDLEWSKPKPSANDPDKVFDQEDDSEETDEVEPESEQQVEEEHDEDYSEILEQRTEEKLALESIFDDRFKERVENKVWVVSLELPELTELARLSISDRDRASFSSSLSKAQYTSSKKNICQFYLKGNCRYGARCKQSHQVAYEQTHSNSKNGANKEAETNEFDYQLEIRFPRNNKYPLDGTPFIAFHSTNLLLPQHVCLNLTDYVMQVVKQEASAGLPIIYTLVSSLENNEDLHKIFAKPTHKFSLPEPLISRKEYNTESAASNKWDRSVKAGSLELISNASDYLNRDFEGVGEQLGMAGSLADSTPVSAEEAVDRTEELRSKYSRKEVTPKEINSSQVEKINLQLKASYKKLKVRSDYQKMLERRKELPAWNESENIVSMLKSNQVIVISGETGCGKTTQVPQFILDHFLGISGAQLCNIVCTQPRRISAMAVAERVAQERLDRIGQSVGYQIRLESVMSSKTRLLFCTTGILLRRLEGESNLKGITHVIVDEVHERSEESDFLMMILNNVIIVRPDLRLILMSATLNAELFSQYYRNCPVIHIPGKTFPVDQYFLEDAVELAEYVIEDKSQYARPLKSQNAVRQDSKRKATRASLEEIDESLAHMTLASDQPPKNNIQDQNLSAKQLFLRYTDHKKSTVKALAIMDHEKINLDLIEALIEFIIYGKHHYPRDGAILIFLPGYAEIQNMFDQLQTSHVTGGKNKNQFKIIPLHSTLSSEDQKSVFLRPREGVTKIVLATNIAETSITIDDIVFVIDAGQMKEKRYDSSKGMESLETVWVSKANALQRKGRAGRVTSGVCFHLFTSHRFDYHLKEQPIPEIRRVPLEQTVLKIKILPLFKDCEVEDVLACLIEAPEMINIERAIKRLQDLGALDDQKQLTPLGYHVAALPVDVRIGKLMLFGAIFRCLDPALTIAAMLSFKSPFVAPFGKKDEADAKKLEFAVGNSDHLSMLKAYKGWLESQKRGSYAGYCFCQDNYLSIKSLQMIASMKCQFVELLSDIGFVESGLTCKGIERSARDGGDGVQQACGPEANCNSENYKLVAAILVAALYPNVVQVFSPENKFQQSSAGAIPMAPKADDLRFKTKIDGYVNIHPSSVNFQVRYYSSPYLVFHEKVKTSKVYIRDCSMVSVYPLLLFGGGITIDLDKGDIVISVDDGWIRFKATSSQVAELVRELRLELDRLLKDKIEEPNLDLCTCPRGSRIISTIVKLITTQ